MPFKETVLPDVIARGLVNELCHFPHEDADLGDLDGFNKNTLGLASFILCSSTRRFRSSKSRCSSLSGHARAASAEFLKFGSTGAPQQPVLRMDEMTTYTVQRLTAWPPPYVTGGRGNTGRVRKRRTFPVCRRGCRYCRPLPVVTQGGDHIPGIADAKAGSYVPCHKP